MAAHVDASGGMVEIAEAQQYFTTRRLTHLPKLCKLCNIAARKPPPRRRGKGPTVRNGNVLPQRAG